MSSLMYRRCALALFVAMLLASGCGLLAIGPIDGLSEGAAPASTLDRAAAALLLAAALWSLRRLRLGDPSPWERAWRLSAMAMTAAAVLMLLPLPSLAQEVREALGQMLRGAGCLWLVLGFLAERTSAAAARAAGGVWVPAVAVAALAWWWSYRDTSLLIWMELTPVWLLPSGLPHLRGRITRAGDWWALVFAYAAGQIGHVVALPPGAREWALCSGLAAAYGWLGYRVSATGPSQRSTSLNTSS